MQEKREQIFQTAIEDEMKTSYIDYAMSVIVGRALPDVRDGLKPVHRRIIYAMNELGLAPNRPFMKCARIVGETMGKYHPHGDAAIYDTLVRLAQVFSCRYPLINGQGNFGSVDGDPPAAMRYTEARMARFSELLLNDIDRRTVDFRPNYDGRNMEPDVLPAAFPNLLVNGSSGIAVGMANNIPPHNLGEVIDAAIMLIDAPETTIEQMLEVLPGPDFPTGGFIVGRAGIKKAYATGRGGITIRARMQTEQLKHGKEAIVITEIPFQVNKSKLQEDIARLIKEKKIQGITDMRDESDRDGMRIVLELKKDEIPQVIINQLLKHTQLQITFGIILLALVDGRPRYMSLKKILQFYIDHRVEVVTRRTQFELEKAEARLHIVDGLVIALDNLDAVITLIRKAKMVDEAREKLMAKFGLSQIQAQAILDMRLQRLTGLEREKIMNEKKDLEKLIKHLVAILEDSRKVLKIVKKEMREIKEKFSDPRRSEIIDADTELSLEDLIAEERMIITISHQGYIKRTPTYLYRRQNRGGKGVYGMTTKEEDWAEHIFIGTTHNYLLVFTSEGRAYWLKVYELPQAGRATRGRPIVNMLNLQPGETVKGMIPVSKFDDDHFLVMATKKGMVIKNALSLYKNPRKGGVKAVKIAKDDELVEVKLTNGQQEIFIGSSNGMAVRFHESDTRPTGRFTGGVIGIRLAKNAEVVGMAACHPNASILTVCENGYGKRTNIDQYRLIKRGGKGVINIKTTERNGNVVTVKQVFDNDELIMITQKGMTIRSPIATIRTISRNTQGVRLINLEKDDKITSVAWIEEQKEEAIEEGKDLNGENNDVKKSGDGNEKEL